MTEGDALYPLRAFRGAHPPAPEWFTQALNVRPDRTLLEVDGARVECLSWGQVGAPGLLLMHGAMAHADWWSHIAPGLAQTRRVTAISSTGMGGSDWRERYSVALHAREALAAAEQTGLFAGPVRPTMLAHSFGGHALIGAAARWGERFDRAVLLDSAAGSRTRAPTHVVRAVDFASVEEALARFRLLPSQEAEPFVMDWLARCSVAGSPRSSDGRLAWRFDPEIFAKFEPFDDQAGLTAAKCPIVFMRGELSAVCPDEIEDQQRSAAPPGSRFLSIPAAAHHIMVDRPLELIDSLNALLDDR